MAATQPSGSTIVTTFNKGSSSVKDTLTASGVDVKWTRADWLNTEVKLNDFDLLVLKNLVGAASDKLDNVSVCTVMGDYLYQAVRPSLNLGKIKLLKGDDSRVNNSTSGLGGSIKQTKNRKGGRKGGGTKGAKGPSKADQIRMQNSVGGLNTKVEVALSAFDSHIDEFRSPRLFLEKIVEMRGIGFLCCAWFLLTKRKSLSLDQEFTALTYSIIVSLERFIKVTEKLKGKSHVDSLKEDLVSETLIKDLREKLAELKEAFEFNGEKLYLTCPKLLIFSEFDTVLPVSSVKPYPHQARVCKILEENLDNGCYIMYRAITNAGKTTTIAMLAATVQKIRNTRHEKDPLAKLTIIFCCNIKTVTSAAGLWLQNTTHISSIPDLPFAIAFERPETRELVIRNSAMIRPESENRLVIICSPHIATRIMRERSETPYILFHDEPTSGAENRESRNLTKNVEVLMCPPRWTIVSSATLPTEVEFDPFLKKFKRMNPSGHIENVASAKINIGCDIYSHNGTSFLPHLGSGSTDELTECLTNIKDNMFLSRSYTPLSVSELCNFATEYEVPGVPKIGDHFSKIDNLSADAVRLFGLKILDQVSKTDDSTTKEICSKPIKCSGRSVEFANLGTTSASKFSQMSLIASGNPLDFALEAFADYIEEINDTKVYSIEKLVSQYWKVQEQWSSEIEKIKKRKKKPQALSKRRNSTGEVVEIEKQGTGDYGQQAMDLVANKPFLSFPKYYQINTRLHAKKFSPNGKVDVERIPNRDFSFLIEKTVNAPEDVLLLLCCGVGIYAPEDSRVNSGGYLEQVISLAQTGRLAYLVADHNIAYGVNFPFSRTIVCDDFTAEHSMNTVFQLMSRAGRVGQSWFAESFVSDEVVSTMRDYSHSDKSPDGQVEIKNMISVAREITLREREKQRSAR
ncbi:uncharacterized protein LOC134815340 [Bolinopsis microptera]|uniref:uncharacterized protein LOC134815340 n=1 Tax=Bolinopsis microptera TaxID=2820187 RepID=UPI00307B0C09